MVGVGVVGSRGGVVGSRGGRGLVWGGEGQGVGWWESRSGRGLGRVKRWGSRAGV